MWRFGAICLALFALLGVTSAHAGGVGVNGLDPFELQVYDGEVLDAGVPMLELHAVSYANAFGAPNTGFDPGLMHLTLEPQVGLGKGFELGGYFETGYWPQGGYQVEGAKLRAKAKFSPDSWPVQVAVNVEVGRGDPMTGEAVWGAEIRPIVSGHFGPVRAAFNPIVDMDFMPAGPVTFQPAAKVNCEVGWGIAPGIEYYTDLGPILSLLPVVQETHLLMVTLDVYRWKNIEINLGAGIPLTQVTGGFVGNANLGVVLP